MFEAKPAAGFVWSRKIRKTVLSRTVGKIQEILLKPEGS